MGGGKPNPFTGRAWRASTSSPKWGRCQAGCPGWTPNKPLSPKLLVMTLRDHANAKAPYLMATEGERPDLPAHTLKLADAPLIGEPTAYDVAHPLTAYDALGTDGVIHEDVLWSCTTCGACVEQCPVDIEPVSYTHLRAHETVLDIVCRLLLEKKKHTTP